MIRGGQSRGSLKTKDLTPGTLEKLVSIMLLRCNHPMMSLTALVSFVSSEKELISLREPQTCSLSLLFSTGADDLDERLSCWSETRRMGEEGADARPRCQV